MDGGSVYKGAGRGSPGYYSVFCLHPTGPSAASHFLNTDGFSARLRVAVRRDARRRRGLCARTAGWRQYEGRAAAHAGPGRDPQHLQAGPGEPYRPVARQEQVRVHAEAAPQEA